MNALHLGDVVPALDNPEPTETKLGRQWEESGWTGATPTSSPLSKAQIESTHGLEAAHQPQWHTGSFRAALGMRQPAFEKLCAEMARRWMDEMARRGFDPCSTTRVQIDPGPYPAKDMSTGLLLLGEREMLIRAQFLVRHPTLTRVEVPGELFGLAPNSGEE